MRTLSKFSYSATLVLALVLAGCAATKSASAPEPRSVDGDAASAALHEQALRALDARMFVIKGDEDVYKRQQFEPCACGSFLYIHNSV